MRVTSKVEEILGWYEGECPGVRANLVRPLMNAQLGRDGFQRPRRQTTELLDQVTKIYLGTA